MAGDYERHKEHARERQAEIAKAGRDITIPPVADPDRKELCRDDLELFLVTYLPARFPLAFASVHRAVIAKIQACVLDTAGESNLYALSFMRGGGKTTIAEGAVIWASVFGHRRFAVLLQATQPLAARSLKKVRQEFEGNDLLLADFPEACAPIRALERIHNRAKGQTVGGVPTDIEVTADGIVLPTVAGSACSGVAIHVVGITGSVKGLSMLGPEGEIVRPDFILLDDCQTRESAKSPTQTLEREAIITDDVLNLAGPGRSIAAVFLCTPIYPDDLVERFLDKEKHPEWKSQRTPMLTSMPKNLTLWDEYAELRRNGQRDDRGTGDADEFYAKHRAEMDAGAVASWPERLSAGPVTASSAVELAMILHAQNPRGFAAEYQCRPDKADLERGAKEFVPAEIAKRLNGVERYMVPAESTRVTCFIDPGVYAHWYMVVAWNESFGGSIVDYGCWPPQNRTFFIASDARPSLSDRYAGMTPSQVTFAGLQDLAAQVLGRTYYRQGGGEVHVERCLVDSGNETKAVYLWVRQSPFAGVLHPSKGFARTMTSHGISEWKPRPGERTGYHWRLTQGEESRIKCVQFDPDAWKSFLYGALNTPPGGKNGIFLYGKAASAHEMVSHHLSAEYSGPATIRGKTFDKWLAKAGKPDNHWLDTLVGNCVAANVQGLRWEEGALAGQVVPVAPRPALRLSDLQNSRSSAASPSTPATTAGGPISLSALQAERDGGEWRHPSWR